MPTADEVIVEFEARVGGYEADVKRAARTFEQSTKSQEARMKALERQIAASSGNIKNSLKGLAGSIAGYFTGRELVGLLDSFTRLQNNLRVAGVAGDQMKAVQDRLFVSAQKYGVELEGLSKLFSTLTQSSKELGATQQQIFGITDAVSAALKVSGVSAQEASGALQQLGQALRGGNIQAEEFNSLLDGLYPLLEAAAAGSKVWGGSVAKLTADVKAGNVSSQQFFQSILAGSSVLEGKASQATLTLSSGFTTLTNALTVYFGEADKANGVSAALGEALGTLADNLDTLIPAIAAVSGALGVGFVANALRARVAAMALGAASVGAAGAMGTLGFAAGRAGAALLGLFGGPLGATIIAIGAAIYGLNVRMEQLSEGTGRYRGIEEQANGTRKRAAEVAQQLAGATGKARDAALKNAEAIRAETVQYIANARAALVAAKAKAQAAGIEAKSSVFTTGAPGNPLRAMAVAFGIGPGVQAAKAKADVKLLEAVIKEGETAIAQLNAAAKAPPAVGGGVAAGSSKAAKTPKAPKAASGPSKDEIAHRFDAERAQLMQQYNSTLAGMAQSAEERAEYELRNVELARIRTEADINANKDYSAAQKKILKGHLEQLAEVERDRVNYEKTRQQEQDAQQLADEEFRSKQDALRIQFDLADSQAERKRLALEILAAEQEHLKATLEAVIASKTASDADKKRAEVALRGLEAIKAGEQARTSKQNRTELESYLDVINMTQAETNEAMENIAVDGLKRLEDGLLGVIDGTKSVGDAFRDMTAGILADLMRIAIRKMIVAPIANALFGGMAEGGLVQGFAGGGYISGRGTSTSDSIPTMLSNGEYVVKAAAVRRIGVDKLDAMNRGLVLPSGGLRSSQPAPASNDNRSWTVNAAFPGVTDAREARKTEAQLSRMLRQNLNPMRGV